MKSKVFTRFTSHKNVTQKERGRSGATFHQWVCFAPYFLALFFALWGLRGATPDNVVDTDAARHLMNGVFVHDLIRNGKFAEPIEYGKYYYSRLPSLSMPYHPPLFPVIESLFFFVFGVNAFAARLLIAIATAASALLFYRLIVATHASHALAIVSTVTFFSMKLSHWVSGEVMLEFPSLAFILGSLYCLPILGSKWPLRRGLMFAVLAGAAVWTKQHAVFLGMVPFFYIIISRRWRSLADKTVWMSSLLFAGSVIALLQLSSLVDNTSARQASVVHLVERHRYAPLVWGFLHNPSYYVGGIQKTLGTFPTAFIAVAFVFFLFAPRRKVKMGANDLYLAWALAVFLLLLLVGAHSRRYLFYLYPGLIVIGYAGLFRLWGWFLPQGSVWYIPATVAGFYFILHMDTSIHFIQGPAQAAKHVVTGAPGRVLYCGWTNGSFIFSTRRLDAKLQTVVIRGEKLEASTFEAEAFENFAHDYGINYIVLENTAKYTGWKNTEESSPWERLRTSPSPSMVLERVIPLKSSWKFLEGNLYVYRFTNPSANPKNTLKLPSRLAGGDIDMEF